MRRQHVFLAGAAILAALHPACGGSGSPSPGSPTSTPAPGFSAGPCTAALAASLGASASAASPSPKSDGFGPDDRDPREFLALHRLAGDGSVSARATTSAAARSGDIAVLEDDGSMVVGADPFDLGGVALRFDPNGQGGYDVRRSTFGFRADLGRRLSLPDDGTSEEPLAFSFPFFGAARSSAFVNSDGNLTFGGGDVATATRSLGRLLSGAPRVAPFFADLDPSAGGGIFVSGSADAFTVTWCAVPDFEETGSVTAQASLLPGGEVEVWIDASTTLTRSRTWVGAPSARPRPSGGTARSTSTMGLLAESEVPRAFYVESPSGASQDPESAPQTGVGFAGTRREVSIGDVVAAMGPRDPPASRSPRVHRQAWVYVVGRGRTADPAAIAKLETIRRAFEGFFREATGGRMSVETGLD